MQWAGPEGPVVEGGPGRRGPGVPGGGSPRDAVPRGLDADAAEEARLASQPAGLSPRLRGASVSARLPWRWAGGGRGLRGKEVSAQPRRGSRPPAALAAELGSPLPALRRARAWGRRARAPRPSRRARGRAPPPPRTDGRAVSCASGSGGRAPPAERLQDAHQGVPHSAAHEPGRVPGGPALHDPGEGGGK